MRKLLFIAICLCTILPSKAVYYSINIDVKTVAAMVAAYGSEQAAEIYYREQIQNIMKDYEAAELATAGIFASKYLDRKAITDAGIWASSTENYYYKRIYNMVAAKIMPKIYNVTSMMVDSPQNCLYWGTYLMKVCKETESLCKQFEYVVTNGKLTFKDITFLKFKDEYAKMFNFSELGNIDFKRMFDDFSSSIKDYDEEDIEDEMTNFYELGVGLASSGFSGTYDNLLSYCGFNSEFQKKYKDVSNAINSYSKTFEAVKKGLGGDFKELLGEGGVSSLFDVSDYNTSQWQSDYTNYEAEEADSNKMSGITVATISVNCHDGVTYGEGKTRYKCSTCGKSLTAHTKECSMQTSVTDEPLDTHEIDEQISQIKSEIAALESQISALEKDNADLIKLINSGSVDDARTYREQYNKNQTKIRELQKALDEKNAQLDEYNNARDEIIESESEQTDDYYRIPAIMQDCRTIYNLTWNNDGHWDGYTYVRTATVPNIKGVLTFKAELKMARKAKYFLFIKIYRAIIEINWKLTAEWDDSQVVAKLVFNSDTSNEEKARQVNDKLAEVRNTFPDCTPSVTYESSKEPEEDTTEDSQHLLWSSERLEIAREVDARLTRIYGNLCSLEKMMSYKRSVLQVLSHIAPDIDDEQGRRLTIIQQSHKNWLDNAKKINEK